MNKIENNMLKEIVGGATISGAVISALKGYFNTLLTIGQTLGGAIRRISTGNLCKY